MSLRCHVLSSAVSDLISEGAWLAMGLRAVVDVLDRTEKERTLRRYMLELTFWI
jgi:hypothetical protein